MNGAEYEGCFKDDLENGKGVLTYAPDKSCHKFEGFWKDGKKCGEGVLHYKDGTKYSGNFENDNMEGKATAY